MDVAFESEISNNSADGRGCAGIYEGYAAVAAAVLSDHGGSTVTANVNVAGPSPFLHQLHACNLYYLLAFLFCVSNS
jgi:hypothetical protein